MIDSIKACVELAADVLESSERVENVKGRIAFGISSSGAPFVDRFVFD